MAACKATVGVTCKAAAVEHMGLDFKASSLEEAVDNLVEVGQHIAVDRLVATESLGRAVVVKPRL